MIKAKSYKCNSTASAGFKALKRRKKNSLVSPRKIVTCSGSEGKNESVNLGLKTSLKRLRSLVHREEG